MYNKKTCPKRFKDLICKLKAFSQLRKQNTENIFLVP